MAEKFKLEVEVDSKSLNKLKQTLRDVKVEIKQDQLGGLEDKMSDLQEAITMNTTQLVGLRNEFERMSQSGGGMGGDLGGMPSGGSTADILNKIADMLEQNGVRLKTLAGTSEKGFDVEGHRLLKIMSLGQLQLDDQLKTKRMLMRGIIGGANEGSGIGKLLKVGAGAIFGELSTTMSDLMKYEKGKTDIAAELGGAKVPLSDEQKQNIGKERGITDLKKTQEKANTVLGKILTKIGGAAGGRGMAIMGGMALGAMGVASLVKKGMTSLIEASPMLKQMMKMLNFGIMMVLRPLGDFFGFFLRPIFVYLLRKFIIPFYQTYLPIAQKMGTDLGKFVVGWLTWATSIYEMLGGSRKIDEQILDLSKKQTQAEVHAELTEPSLVSETPNKASTIVDVFGGGSLTDEQLGISGDINADRAVEAGEAAIATLDTFGEAFIGVDDLGKNISAAGESIGKWWEGLNLFGADLSYLEGKNISGTVSTGQGTVYIDNTTIFNGDNLPIEDIVKQEEEDSENIGTGFSRGIAAQQEDT